MTARVIRGETFRDTRAAFSREFMNVVNGPDRMTPAQVNREGELLINAQIENNRKPRPALAQTRTGTSRMSSAISAISGVINKLPNPLTRKNSLLARNPDNNGFFGRSPPSVGGYNSRKYKKPKRATILPKKPKRATILPKKPKRATILPKKPKRATILPKKLKKAIKVKAIN